MLTIALCDDDINVLEELGSILEGFADEFGIKVNFEKYSSGIELYNVFNSLEDKNLTWDIVYLDIHMPGLDGLATASKLREEGFENEIIFNTISMPEVFDSFDVDAFHYIVKEETSIEKQRKIFANAVKGVKKKRENFITVSCGGESLTIPLADVRYFKVEDKIVKLYYKKNKVFEFYTSLNKVWYSLIDKDFVRISKISLINMAFVNKRSKTDLTLLTGEKFKIGRAYAKDATYMLDEYFKTKEVLRV
ncbi:MAG: LytTR family transcriptional regulator DNA-binding domain-containing protein [Lachnospiraceae bacterium]|jgi:DNA-binding LytR/AlgR family response regulator|nr:LytTR family transcriptional regulator DNA-binding domain-containing protein [Lachnospiraceae bacterium]